MTSFLIPYLYYQLFNPLYKIQSAPFELTQYTTPLSFSLSQAQCCSIFLKENSMAGVRKRNGYSKIDKEDPEEVIHRRARFLVYKVMQQAEYRRRPSNLRIRIRKLKVKFGMRLKKLRKSMLLSISAARVVVYKQVSRQLKTCKSLFGRVEEPLPAFNVCKFAV
uniref:uncharacterized protein LOC101291313 n=1 Tax=Fragaria vesca subsp. vesca TaxID=101020 RepID=UPI0005C8E6F6|nr:PREDICTED: uncharacterized protein LOC101291313 [Fragaria vesca subsp. vesca]